MNRKNNMYDMNFKNRTMRLTLLYEKKVTKALGASANTLALGLQKCKESVLAAKSMFHSFLFPMKVTESFCWMCYMNRKNNMVL